MVDQFDPRSPTRRELARIFRDQRMIRAFEKLFDLIPTELTEALVAPSTSSVTAALKAIQDELSLQSAPSASSSILGALKAMRDELSSQPAPYIGSLGRQDYYNVSVTGGEVDNTKIGQTIPESGAFTTLRADGGKIGGDEVVDPCAILELSSTEKGFLVPRMSQVQRDAIVNLCDYLLIVNTDAGQFEYYNGTDWLSLAGTLKGRVTLANPIYPPTIASDQDDYDPTGFTNTNAMYLQSDGDRSITGLQAPVPAAAQVIWIFNYGSNNITLKDDDSGSLAPNRLLLGANKTLQSNESISLIYDPNLAGVTQLGWRAGGIVI